MDINNRYNLYIKQCIDLAATTLIKLDDVATSMNTGVTYKHGTDSVDYTDQSTWKYYQNISGEYHFSDEVMIIKSLDVNSEIEFTVENLKIHRLTKKEYVYGSRYYKELILKYPSQELLILGIINPANKEKVINSKDGTIISYPKSLVESNESNLINKLQEWIYNYLFRWVNRHYTMSDELYTSTYIYQLTMHMLQAIISFRLEACKTNEAHSYHIRSYLASHGFLDYYLDALTIKQSLFFYRNIRYIERHAGKADTFAWLVENTMTERSIPLYEFKINHDYSEISRSIIPTQGTPSTDITLSDITNRDPNPIVSVSRKPVNEIAKANDKIPYDLQTALDVTANNAKDNITFNNDNYDTILNDFKYNDSAVTQTKVLQSFINESGNIYYYTLADIIYNHWIYLSAIGRYKPSVFLILPKSNTNLILDPQQTVMLYMYCISKAYSENNAIIDTLHIPKVRVNRVVKIPKTTIDDIKKVVDTSILTDDDINAVMNTSTNIDPFYSIPDFTDLCLNIYEKSKYQYKLCGNVEEMYKRAYMQTAVDSLYCDATVSFDKLVSSTGDVMTFKEFMASIDLDTSDYTTSDYLELSALILNKATLTVLDEISQLGYIQKSMGELLLQLSSYSIQLVSTMSTTPTILVPTNSVRTGNANNQEHFDGFLLAAMVEVIDRGYTHEFNIPLESNLNDAGEDIYSTIGYASSGYFNATDDVLVEIVADGSKVHFDYGSLQTGMISKSTFTLSGNFADMPLEVKKAML